ncbi:MAG: hypothetical protein U9R25_09895 [Chloroflexota bacterium]|nr:hypothetical protein [Chloroflexota bacterium]
MENEKIAKNDRITESSGSSFWAILRRRWWIIALLMAGAIAVTLIASLGAPSIYRSSLRLQAFALDQQEVTLYTRLGTLGADEQIFLVQNNFSDVLQSPLIAWRTIDDLGLDMSASDLIDNLTISASGEFVSVVYEADSSEEAFETLTRHVENALEHQNTLRARPAAATGKFIATELDIQGQELTAAQNALLQFQLEHNVGDLPREINAVQDLLRGLQLERDAAQVEADRAEELAAQWQGFADAALADLEVAERDLGELLLTQPAGEDGEVPPETLSQEALSEIDALKEQTVFLQNQARGHQATAQTQLANAAAQRAVATQQDSLISQRTADLSQLISLSSDYQDLVSDVVNSEANYDFLRAKAAEARLKERQISEVGSLQVVEPAFLPGAPASSTTLRLVLLATLVSLLFGLVLVLLLEFMNPTKSVGS